VAGATQIAVFIALDISKHRFLQARTGELSSPDVQAALRNAVAQGLRAQLANQSLVTGQLYVSLDYFPNIPVRLTGLDPNVPEIPTVPSTVQQASEQLRRLVERVEALPVEQLVTSTVGAVDSVRALAESPQIRQALTNIDAAVRDTRTLVVKLEAQVGPVAGSARQTLNETRAAVAELRGALIKTVREIDKQIDPLAANTGQTLDATKALMLDAQRLVNETRDLVGPLAASATRAAEAARLTLEKTQGTLASADGFLAEETPLGHQLGETLVELAEAARALRVLADALEREPSSLVFGKRPAGTR
jgi:paraquat-inducible protein B